MRFIIWIIVAVIMADALLRLTILKDNTRFDFVKSDKSGSRTLLVYLPGILADGKQSSLLMVDTWKQYGDVLLVSYDGKRFKPDNITRDIDRWVAKNGADYREVVFIGSSLGGLLAYDAAPKLEDDGLLVRYVFVAAPTGYGDLKGAGKASPAMYLWWGGPISNATTGKWLLKGLFQEPKDDNIEPEVHRDELKQRVEEAKNSPFSVYGDQIRYVLGHGKPARDTLVGVKAVYIRCDRDELVADDAYDSWSSAFGDSRNLPLIESDTTHVGYNEMPTTFRKDFVRAFESLGLPKD